MQQTIITLEAARQLYDDSDPVHDFDHVLRVLRLAQRIAAAEGADLAVVETAVLLHDVSRPDTEHDAGDHTGDHAILAADFARALLARHDPAPDAAFIDAVAHAIAAHRFRNTIEPATLEAQCVFDADKLDAIGAIGVARAYAYGARGGQKLWAEVPPDYDGTGPQHTPHHEYMFKLRHIAGRLYTTTGRAIARERQAFMAAFFERLAAEVSGRA